MNTLDKLMRCMLASLLLILAVILASMYFSLPSIHTDITAKNPDFSIYRIGTYIISLDNSKRRYEEISSDLKSAGFDVQRVAAINGDAISSEEVDKLLDLQGYLLIIGKVPKMGTIGCYLSHLKAWTEFLESDFDYAIILEDDVTFDAEVLAVTSRRLIEYRNYWDINNFEVKHSGMPLTIKSFPDGERLVVYLTEVTHSGGYMINRKAAYKLLEDALPIKMPIDHYFSRSWLKGLQLTGIEPRIIKQTFMGSEIGKTKTLSTPISLSITIRCAINKAWSYVVRFVYNLKCYFADITIKHFMQKNL